MLRCACHLNRAGCYAARLEPCPFCTVASGPVWLETEHAIAFGAACPVADGHMIVATRKHVASMYELSLSGQTAMWELVAEVRKRLLTGLKPESFKIGFSDGTVAGQTVSHAHVHIIPQRQGQETDLPTGVQWVVADNQPFGSR